MNLDIIVAILGIISAIVGLLTAIIQLKNATHQRRHQESQDDRSYIDIGIGKWLKRALILFGVPFAILLAYREWDSVEKGIWDAKGFADKAITREIAINSLQEASWENIPKGTYIITLSGSEYLYKCHPEKPGTRTGYPEGKRADKGKIEGWTGRIQVWSPLTADKKGSGGTVVIGNDGKTFLGFDVECPDGKVVYPTTAFVRLTPTTIK